MAKIICNRIEYLTTDDIESEWISIKTTGKIEYSNKKSNQQSGKLKEETVVVKAFTDNTVDISEISTKYFVLRLHTDTNIFIVGGQQFPSILEINGDGVTDILTFTRKSLE